MRRLSAQVCFTLGFSALVGSIFCGHAVAAGWSGLRGPAYDGAARDARLFSTEATPALAVGWLTSLGSGYSTVAAGDGRVFTLFATPDSDVAAAFDAATGKEIWRYRIDEAYKGHDGSHDGPIASPLLAGGRLYGLGPRGRLFALDAATGAPVWSRNVAEEHGAKAPHYGFATSPILVDGVLVVEIGAGEGKAVAGFKPDDGALIWTAGDDAISYHSPIAATIGGRLQVLAAGKKSLLGLDAATGKVLWSYAHQGDEAPMGGESVIPVQAGDGRFLLKNKNDSSTMIQVESNGEGGYRVSEVWSSNSVRASYVIPVYYDGNLYGMTGRILTCVDAATGQARWKSREPGDGFPTLVGKHLVIITKPGTLHVAEASPETYKEVARLDLFQEQSWSSVAYADGHLYVRSMGHLARIDVSSSPATGDRGPTWIAGTAFGRFLDEASKATDKNAVIDAFLARQKSFPIIEEDGAVHFVYKGEAKDVGIVGDMIGFRREDPMSRLPGTDVFHYSTRLEPDASVTYGFIVDYAKPVADPRNPRPGKGLFGDVSWFSMPAWREPGYLAEAAAARRGKLDTVEFESRVHEGKKRVVQVYLPSGYDAQPDRRYPALYINDGKEALEQGALKNALDQLIGAMVEPVIVVFVIPDQENPRRDLGEVESYTEMLVKEIVPKVDERYRTRAVASARATAGAAGGANAALYIAFKHPDVFSRVASQSATMMRAEEYAEIIRPAEQQSLVIYLGWGTYHLRSPHEAWDMVRANRDLWALLRERGHRPAGGESPDGFGWNCWRAHLDRMLTALFPLLPA